ncbi:MAG: hypothetical protein ACU0AU_11730 [Cognatishimia activa]
MNQDTQTVLLTTVNAPYQTYREGSASAAALNAGEITIGQVNSFFMEAKVADQLAFAKQHGVRIATLIETAKAFAIWSGQNPAILA